MPDPSKKVVQSKALLAILFASGLLNNQLPAVAEKKVVSNESAVEKIAGHAQLLPEFRAYYLLRLAEAYLTDGKKTAKEAQYVKALEQVSLDWSFRSPARFNPMLAEWADSMALDSHGTTVAGVKTKPALYSKRGEELVLADDAIRAALKQLDAATDPFTKLNLYFVAARLSQKSVNLDELRKCNNYLSEFLKSCEHSSKVDKNEIKAASSVLNSMAYGIIPVQIADRQTPAQAAKVSFSENDFKESEKLKLRAAALVDRLDATDDVRRKFHRNLVLWYRALGKEPMANKELEVLYGLVGIKDESILWPQAGACGHLVWWEANRPRIMVKCGMG